MKHIRTNGITYLEPLSGSNEWYWGMDYTSGDLYEAEELFRHGHPIQKNRLILIRYPAGIVYVPLRPEAGQYLGKPVYHNGQVALLLVDFPKQEIQILAFDEMTEQTSPLAILPLSIAEDCYNLMLEASPFMLTRSANDNKFQILWPERREFLLEDRESLSFLDGDKMYTEIWYEDPDYREETLVRDLATGEILERIPGSLHVMPDGQKWFLV